MIRNVATFLLVTVCWVGGAQPDVECEKINIQPLCNDLGPPLADIVLFGLSLFGLPLKALKRISASRCCPLWVFPFRSLKCVC